MYLAASLEAEVTSSPVPHLPSEENGRNSIGVRKPEAPVVSSPVRNPIRPYSLINGDFNNSFNNGLGAETNGVTYVPRVART